MLLICKAGIKTMNIDEAIGIMSQTQLEADVLILIKIVKKPLRK